MFKKSILSIALIAIFIELLPFALSAQPFGRDPEDSMHGEWNPGSRLEKMARFLELDEQQAEQWLQIVERHFAQASSHQDSIAELRRQFRQQAKLDEPDLNALGRIALDIHNEMETTRLEREQMKSDLESILTPDQLDRFEAFRTAREFAGPRPQGPRPRRGHESTEG
ncbi:MAG: Spy/CpxP family protein refolding chaperone [Acidobacteriota bacterium]